MPSSNEAPRPSSNRNTQEAQPVVDPRHIDRVDYDKITLQEAVERGLVSIDAPESPNDDLHGPQTARENTPTLTTKKSLRERIKELPPKKKAFLYIGSAAAGAAIGVLPFASQLSATEYTVKKDGTVLAGDTVLDDGATHEDPSSSETLINPELAYAVEKLTDMREDSANKLRELGVPVDIPEEQSDETSSEELLGKYNADLYTIVKIGETNPTEAERLLPGLMNPDNTDDFTQLTDKVIGKITADSLADNPFKEVIDWSDNFYTGMVQNVEPNGEATRFITATTADTYANQFTFQRQNGEWILQKQLPLEDPQAILSTYDFNQSIPPR